MNVSRRAETIHAPSSLSRWTGMRAASFLILGLLLGTDARGQDAVEQGRGIFLSSSCVLCHTVRGTSAAGRIGPDLTHVASRRMLAAATVSNNAGNLAGWILNPQNVKPGAKMPATLLSSSDLHALVAYLQSLR